MLGNVCSLEKGSTLGYIITFKKFFQATRRLDDAYKIQKFLKIPDTNILLIASGIKDSQGYIVKSIVYYYDMSSQQDNVIYSIQTDYSVTQLQYIKHLGKILIASYSKLIIANVYILDAEKSIYFGSINNVSFIKYTNYAFLTKTTCQSLIIDITNLNVLATADPSVLDSTGFQTWTYAKDTSQVVFRGYLPNLNNRYYRDIDILSPHNIILAVGSYYTVDAFQIIQKNNKFIYEEIRSYHSFFSTNKKSTRIFLNDSWKIFVLNFTLTQDPSTKLYQIKYSKSLKVSYSLTGSTSYYPWYYIEENQQIALRVEHQNFTLVNIFSCSNNSIAQKLFYFTSPNTKIYQQTFNKQIYYVEVMQNVLYILKYNLNGYKYKQINISSYLLPFSSSFMKVKNYSFGYVSLLANNKIQFNKLFQDEQSKIADIKSNYGLSLNQTGQVYETFYDGINSIWYQKLISDNSDDNINQTCYALYSEINKQIVGLDQNGNVYVWDSQKITHLQYKKKEMGTLFNIQQQGRYIIIGPKFYYWQFVKIYKLSCMPDTIVSFEEIQLVVVDDNESGYIYLYKFNASSGMFSFFMKFYTNQNIVVNISYLSDKQLLWIQYQYSNTYFPMAQCLNDVNDCLNCEMDFYFKTNEKIESNNNYGLGTLNSSFITSSSILTAFLKMQQYSQFIDGLQKLNSYFCLNPSQNFTLFYELFRIPFAKLANLNLISLNQIEQANLYNYYWLTLSDFQSLTLENLIIYFIVSKGHYCGILLINLKINNCTLNKNFSILSQISNTQLILNNTIIGNNTCNITQNMLSQAQGQLFQASFYQVDNLTVINNTFCDQRIFSTISSFDSINQTYSFSNIMIEQDQFLTRSSYIFFNVVYYFNLIPTHQLILSNIYSNQNFYLPNMNDQQKEMKMDFNTAQLFQINKIQTLKISNITMKNHFEIAFAQISSAQYVYMNNISCSNDQNFKPSSISNQYAGFVQLLEINNLNLTMFNSSNINAIDNSLITLINQNYFNNIIYLSNIQIFNSIFIQTKTSYQVNPIYFSSVYYSLITIQSSKFQGNILHSFTAYKHNMLFFPFFCVSEAPNNIQSSIEKRNRNLLVLIFPNIIFYQITDLISLEKQQEKDFPALPVMQDIQISQMLDYKIPQQLTNQGFFQLQQLSIIQSQNSSLSFDGFNSSSLIQTIASKLSLFISSDNSNISISNSNFTNSKFNQSLIDISKGILVIKNSIFKNITQITNATYYGDDKFSYPNQLYLVNYADFKDQFDSATQKIILNEFKSGGTLPNFIFELRDDSLKPVVSVQGEILQIYGNYWNQSFSKQQKYDYIYCKEFNSYVWKLALTPILILLCTKQINNINAEKILRKIKIKSIHKSNNQLYLDYSQFNYIQQDVWYKQSYFV
ncbi:hypothetical protein ABPG72_011101 [Tetrahymena utriculariae]